ncbi:NF038143 family protein [Desulfonatronum thioautotrophicum]|uniref:NF038143 family protein n=1 Tax=Desulfonatronum thioautotrophicum TaxID=617001 RepID=UPI0005EB6349|nr:NF038143 family protein [Desulfonatronum thioautotrophicum]
MSAAIQKTHQMIWDHEQHFAKELARRIVEKPRLTVWRVLFPPFLIYHYIKLREYQADLETFAKGVVRSKILAMESALEETATGKRDAAYKNAFGTHGPESSPGEIRLRNAQIAEMEVLKGHYLKLLRNTGSSYQALVKKTYKTSGEYRRFLGRLAQAEDAVQKEVLHQHQTSTTAQAVSRKMRETAKTLRDTEVNVFFER